jgi:hypothetical protein
MGSAALSRFVLSLAARSFANRQEAPMDERPKRLKLPLLLAALLTLFLCLAGLTAGGLFLLRRQGQQERAILYVLDVSQRMALPAAGAEGSRLEVARNVLAEVIRPADPEFTAGLRVFGSGAVADHCADTQLLVSPAAGAEAEIAGSLDTLEAGGNADAPLGQAMIAAIRDLKDGRGRPILVVVTGGEDSCAPDAVELLAREAEAAGFELQTFVVGFAVGADQAEAIRDLIAGLDGGQYLEAADAERLAAILGAIHDLAGGTATLADVLFAAGSGIGQPEPTLRPTWTATPPTGPTGAATTLPPLPTAAVATATPSPTAAHVAQSACDHLYYPLRLGSRWESERHETLSTAGSWREVTEVTALDGDRSSATAILTVAGVDNTTREIICRDGALYLDGGEDLYLPPAGELAAEAAWGWSDEAALEYEIDCRAGPSETVTTPAGAFEAIRVDCLASWVVLGSRDSQEKTLWYAPRVGEVRAVWTITTQAGDSFAGESFLIDYEIPQGTPAP